MHNLLHIYPEIKPLYSVKLTPKETRKGLLPRAISTGDSRQYKITIPLTQF